jgi:hypothetical protein
MKKRILISSKLLYYYTKDCINNAHPDSGKEINISTMGNAFTIANLSRRSIFFESNNQNDVDLSITYKQLLKLNKFLALITEQPITLLLDSDNACIFINEAII